MSKADDGQAASHVPACPEAAGAGGSTAHKQLPSHGSRMSLYLDAHLPHMPHMPHPHLHVPHMHVPHVPHMHLPHLPHMPNFVRRQERDMLQMGGNLLIVGLIYVFLLLMLGGHHTYDDMLPGGKAWAMFLIWLTASLGGALSEKLTVPPLMGNLIAGIILKNIEPDPVSAFPAVWGETVRLAGLATILMRSGLELDVPAVRRAGLCALRLTLLPGVSEAIVTGGFATLIFGMPTTLGISLGFILAAVSPAVVVVGMFNLQRQGYGVAKGIPSLVVAAASFDDVIAISGFSMFINLAIPSDHSSLAENILHGPLTIVFGVLFGAFGGGLMACTEVWNARWKRTVATFAIGMVFMFGSAKLHYSGSGAMGGLIMGMIASVLWKAGKPEWGAKRADSHYAHRAEADLAFVWELIFQPLLFGVIGTTLDFREIESSTIPKAILLVFIGLATRLPAAYSATYGRGLTFKERAFIALAWLPKATVQAAYSAFPLDLVRKMIDEDDSQYDDYEKWGKEIQTTAVLSILISAPLGLLFIQLLGTKWLTCDIADAAVACSDGHELGKPDNTNKEAPLETVPDDAGSNEGRPMTPVPTPVQPALMSTPHVMSTRELEDSLAELDVLLGTICEEPTTTLTEQGRARMLVRLMRFSAATMNQKSKVLDTAGNFFRLAAAAEQGNTARRITTMRPTHSDECLSSLDSPRADQDFASADRLEAGGGGGDALPRSKPLLRQLSGGAMGSSSSPTSSKSVRKSLPLAALRSASQRAANLAAPVASPSLDKGGTTSADVLEALRSAPEGGFAPASDEDAPGLSIDGILPSAQNSDSPYGRLRSASQKLELVPTDAADEERGLTREL